MSREMKEPIKKAGGLAGILDGGFYIGGMSHITGGQRSCMEDRKENVKERAKKSGGERAAKTGDS